MTGALQASNTSGRQTGETSDEAVHCLQALLQHGIETLSQAEVGSALQVYFNLGLLKQVCHTTPATLATNPPFVSCAVESTLSPIEDARRLQLIAWYLDGFAPCDQDVSGHCFWHACLVSEIAFCMSMSQGFAW